MKIVQEAPFQKRTFEILDSKIIKVVIERFGNINEFTVDPAILDPNAQRVRHISPLWKFVLGFLGIAVFMAIMIGVEPPKDKSDWVAALCFFIGFLATAIASGWKMY